MKVLVKPSDLVKRCLWDTYVYYVIGSEKDAESILLEDIEFEISESDAIVIGLLKCMETDNLIHKFNEHIIHMLTVKSTKDKDVLYIRKKTLETTIEKFMTKFPEYWNMPLNYKKGFEDMRVYIEDFNKNIEKLEIVKMSYQNNIFETYSTNSVKKLLNFNHY